MLHLQHMILVAFSACLLCSATQVLPRAQHAAAESEAFTEIHNVMLRARSSPSARNAPISRRGNESGRPIKDTSSESPLAAIKRKLLGTRYLTCDPGYGLCDASLTCCPYSGNGQCCDDGTCVTKGQTCCANGGACDQGLKCCGPFSCAPEGGECCSGGEYCDPGLHCVILNGVQGCCKTLSCREFGSGGAVPALSSFTFTPVSLTSPSFTPISFEPISVTPISFTHTSFTPITIPSFTPLTFPSITLPTPIVPPATNRAQYSYYTTTWTWYFYTYFMTTVRSSIRTPTSTEVTTTTTLSVYATNSADAVIQFESITLAAAVPTAITAPGFTDEITTPTATSNTATAFRAGGAASNTASSGVSYGAASAAVERYDGFATLLLGICLGLGIGLLAIWL